MKENPTSIPWGEIKILVKFWYYRDLGGTLSPILWDRIGQQEISQQEKFLLDVFGRGSCQSSRHKRDLCMRVGKKKWEKKNSMLRKASSCRLLRSNTSIKKAIPGVRDFFQSICHFKKKLCASRNQNKEGGMKETKKNLPTQTCSPSRKLVRRLRLRACVFFLLAPRIRLVCPFFCPHAPLRLRLRVPRLCCSVLQCVAVCCSVVQDVAVCCRVLQCVAVCCRRQLPCVALFAHRLCCSVLQGAAIGCSGLQWVVACYSVL